MSNMICKKCGHEIPDNAKYCLNCGAPVDDSNANNNDAEVDLRKAVTKPPLILSVWIISGIMFFAGIIVTVNGFGGFLFILVGIVLLLARYYHDDQLTRLKELYISANEKLTLSQLEYEEKIENCKDKAYQDIKDDLNKKKQAYKRELENLKSEIISSEKILSNLQIDITNTKNALNDVQSELFTYDIVPYTFNESITSEEYKNQISILNVEYKTLLKDSIFNGIKITADPETKKSVLNNNVKQLLRCFNLEASAIIANTTTKNIDSSRAKLQRIFETLNRLFKTDGVELIPKVLEYKFEELNLVYSYQLKRELEKEEQKAIKEQMIEEEKVRREIEREKQKIEKEERQFKGEIDKLIRYMQKANDVEKQLYIDKIQELEEKLSLLEKDKENVLEREANTRAGFVYIISNIGSFGEDIYKIGMTRRIEPMDRIKELSSASVPFEFDVHAMIFSEDAPSLENALHKAFENKAVNRVNPRKEFFHVTLSEIENVVKENYNATVEFTQIALAEQYKETQRIIERERVS